MDLNMKPNENSGCLITFCGLDGSGKTTQINLLKNFIEKQGIPVALTKQPTDAVRRSNVFRTYMDTPNHEKYDYRALSLMCASDRLQHTNKEIIPQLKNGQFILSDRYFYSCVANLHARGYTEDRWIYEISIHIVKPDIAFFIDAEVETAVARVRSRKEERNKYIDIDLQHRLRKEYLKIAADNDGIIINADMSVDEMFSIIRDTIQLRILNSNRKQIQIE